MNTDEQFEIGRLESEVQILKQEKEDLHLKLASLHEAFVRKHSVTPVLSEQEIKEEAEKLYPEPKRSDFGWNDSVQYMYAKYEASGARKGYIAAITAKSKQQGDGISKAQQLLAECFEALEIEIDGDIDELEGIEKLYDLLVETKASLRLKR